MPGRFNTPAHPSPRTSSQPRSSRPTARTPAGTSLEAGRPTGQPSRLRRRTAPQTLPGGGPAPPQPCHSVSVHFVSLYLGRRCDLRSGGWPSLLANDSTGISVGSDARERLEKAADRDARDHHSFAGVEGRTAWGSSEESSPFEGAVSGQSLRLAQEIARS